jgi:hypothetical protein
MGAPVPKAYPSIRPVATFEPVLAERCYALCLGCQTANTGDARQGGGEVGSVADGDDFEVFGVDSKCAVLIAVVVFGERNELVTE